MKTPIRDRIERHILHNDPQHFILIHPDDAEKVAKSLWGKFDLPFKTIGIAFIWGGPE